MYKLCNSGEQLGYKICRDQIGIPRSGSGQVRAPRPVGLVMLTRFANFETAAIVLISVIALFFFPAPRGSFVSTHGPVTELRTRTESALLWVSMAVASLRRSLVVTLSAAGIWVRFLVEPPGPHSRYSASLSRVFSLRIYPTLVF